MTQNASYDRIILLLGILVTLLAYLLIVIARTVIRKALKQDWYMFIFFGSIFC